MTNRIIMHRHMQHLPDSITYMKAPNTNHTHQAKSERFTFAADQLCNHSHHDIRRCHVAKGTEIPRQALIRRAPAL